MRIFGGNQKGSLTVEAALLLPLLLVFFFTILVTVQAVTIQINLDQIASETAKIVAASAYPLNLAVPMGEDLSGDFQSFLEMSQETTGIERLYRGLSVGKTQEQVISSITNIFIKGTPLARDKLVLSYIKLPQPLWMEVNGGADVVIEVEYPLGIALPFISQEIILRHRAIEKAWLAGGNGNYTDSTEIGIFEKAQNHVVVFITRTGEKYHTSRCRYLRQSKISKELRDALKSGYEPCKICKPPGIPNVEGR